MLTISIVLKVLKQGFAKDGVEDRGGDSLLAWF